MNRDAGHCVLSSVILPESHETISRYSLLFFVVSIQVPTYALDERTSAGITRTIWTAEQFLQAAHASIAQTMITVIL